MNSRVKHLDSYHYLEVNSMSETQKKRLLLSSLCIVPLALCLIVLGLWSYFENEKREAITAILFSVASFCFATRNFLIIKGSRNWQIWNIVLQIITMLIALLASYVFFFARF